MNAIDRQKQLETDSLQNGVLRYCQSREYAKASDIDLLNGALREEFVRIYSEPALMNFFKEQWQAHRDVELPAMPPPGNLDIRQVLSSPYFFA